MKLGHTIGYVERFHKPRNVNEAIDVVEKTVEWLESLEHHFGDLQEKDGMLIAPNNYAQWLSLWGLLQYLRGLDLENEPESVQHFVGTFGWNENE